MKLREQKVHPQRHRIGTNGHQDGVVPLELRIRNKTAVVAVIGLGYVGLPLAVAIGRSGFPVIGLDVDATKVAQVNRGESYVGDVQPEALQALIERGQLTATTAYAVLEQADVIIVCVPTPLTKAKEPDLSHVVAAARESAAHLRAGGLVILESTTYPGTTEEVVRPILEAGGKRVGKDFHLAFSPERIDPGNREFPFQEIPKIIGGVTPTCARLAKEFYAQVVRRVVEVSSATVAEMVKVYENVFRNVNIALVNELTLLCDRMNLDVWEIIEAAATKPYGFMPFTPGPGVGGHCIPVDPYYLAAKAREYDFHVRFIELAATVNDNMPYHVISRITTALGATGKPLRRAATLVLGVAYKRDIPDVRESPALKIIELLEKAGAQVSYHDPYIPQLTLPNPGVILNSVPLTEAVVSAADCVIIATDHSAIDYTWVAEKGRLIVDTRNALRHVHSPNIVRL